MITLTREEAQQVLDALDLAQALCEKSSHHGRLLREYENLRALIEEAEKERKLTDKEKIVYDILCSNETPPEGHHWEGFVAAKIVKALAQPEPEPVACKRCNGSGVIADSEIEYYEDGTPFKNGPVKCVKDCPDCIHLQPEPKDDGRCQSCEGNHCTAKTGCVALSNPPQNKWEPQIERKYSPDGVLLSEKIKYTSDGEWKDLKQYPVAWWYDMGDVIDLNVSGNGTPLYFVPPQREWQGLTDEEVTACWKDGFDSYEQKTVADLRDFIARAIEAKLKEKNT
jgi:hypothetical protein